MSIPDGMEDTETKEDASKPLDVEPEVIIGEFNFFFLLFLYFNCM